MNTRRSDESSPLQVLTATVYLIDEEVEMRKRMHSHYPPRKQPIRPAYETLARAKQGLQEMGFAVASEGFVLRISGCLSLYEKQFETKVTLVPLSNETCQVVTSVTPCIPHNLRDFIKEIVISRQASQRA